MTSRMRGSSKEDLLLSAIEATPTPSYGTALNDRTRSLRERLTEFGRTMASDEAMLDGARLAASLESVAALLRSPDACRRYGADLRRRLGHRANVAGTGGVSARRVGARLSGRRATCARPHGKRPARGGGRPGLTSRRCGSDHSGTSWDCSPP